MADMFEPPQPSPENVTRLFLEMLNDPAFAADILGISENDLRSGIKQPAMPGTDQARLRFGRGGLFLELPSERGSSLQLRGKSKGLRLEYRKEW